MLPTARRASPPAVPTAIPPPSVARNSRRCIVIDITTGQGTKKVRGYPPLGRLVEKIADAPPDPSLAVLVGVAVALAIQIGFVEDPLAALVAGQVLPVVRDAAVDRLAERRPHLGFGLADGPEVVVAV